MIEPFLISVCVIYLIAAILLRKMTDLRIRIWCVQSIEPSRFSSFGSQFAITISQQRSTNFSILLSMNFAAILMCQQSSFVVKSLNMLFAGIVSYNLVVV